MLRGRKSILRSLTLGLAAAHVAGGLAIGVVLQFRVSAALDDDLRNRAETLTSGLVDALSESIWNLDDRAIAAYMDRYPKTGGVTSVRVMSEFDDVLFLRIVKSENDALVIRRPVYRDDELIGFVEVGVSRADQRTIARAIVTADVLTVGVGLASILAVMLFGARLTIKRPLAALLAGIRRIARGNYEHRSTPTGYREIDDIARAVDDMAEQIAARTQSLHREIAEREAAQKELRSLQGGLEDQVLRRTRELIRSNERLREEIAERQHAQDEILGISEREQQRIGGDLHDALGQQLAGISFLCGSLAKSLRERDPDYAQMAERVGELVSSAVSQTRHIAHGLSPIALQNREFSAALRSLAEDTSDLFDVDCCVDIHGDVSMPDDVATHLYRIAQEAIHNARLHGNAEHIGIHLWIEDGHGRLVVDDDGSGIPAIPSSRGIGLRIMRYRAEAIRGSLVVAPRDKGGTALVVRFPLDPGPSQEQRAGSISSS